MPDDMTVLGTQDNTASADTNQQTQPAAVATAAAPAAEEKTLLGGAAEEAQQSAQQEAAAKTAPGTKDGEQTKPQAPAEYTDFALPEGVTAAPELITEFKSVAKELGLTQDQAQRLVNLQGKAVVAAAQQQLDEFRKTAADWAAQTKKMLGADFAAEMHYAARARDKFATPELVQLLNDTQLGNHPEVVKLFIALGKRISEDTLEAGKAATAPRDIASVMYPTMNQK